MFHHLLIGPSGEGLEASQLFRDAIRESQSQLQALQRLRLESPRYMPAAEPRVTAIAAFDPAVREPAAGADEPTLDRVMRLTQTCFTWRHIARSQANGLGDLHTGPEILTYCVLRSRRNAGSFTAFPA